MSASVLKLNLAPPSNAWRNNHVLLGWSALVLGFLILGGSLGLTWAAYQDAAKSGKLAGNLAMKTRTTAEAQNRVLTELRSLDVAKELPRWRLAERIYTERSLPWSRLTAELERSLVADVRIKSLQRNRGADQKVQLKLKGEARSRAAEAAFVAALEKNPFFEQVIMEREGERQGGGVDFDYTLAAASVPPPYEPLPRFGPAARAGSARPVPAAAARPMPAPRGPAPARTPLPRPGGLAVPAPAGRAPGLPAYPAPGTGPTAPQGANLPFAPAPGAPHPPAGPGSTSQEDEP